MLKLKAYDRILMVTIAWIFTLSCGYTDEKKIAQHFTLNLGMTVPRTFDKFYTSGFSGEIQMGLELNRYFHVGMGFGVSHLIGKTIDTVKIRDINFYEAVPYLRLGCPIAIRFFPFLEFGGGLYVSSETSAINSSAFSGVKYGGGDCKSERKTSSWN